MHTWEAVDMGLPYGAKAVAYYFLELGDRDNVDISPMKLQKLIYFAHGWCLAVFDKPLIDVSVEAWRYGPVIATVYREFKKFGSNPIRGQVPEPDVKAELKELKRDPQVVLLLDRVWQIYSGYTAFQLSEMTHLPGTPWIEAREEDRFGKANVTIRDEAIKEYFEAQTKQKVKS